MLIQLQYIGPQRVAVPLGSLNQITVMQNKILIVDDNIDLLTVLRLGFSKSGFVVRTAANGSEALKKVRSFAPDLILLDLIMPEMDGFAVCEILKKNRDTSHIPIVVLSGLSSQLSRFAGLESGADEYLTKPFNFSELLAQVKGVLERVVPERTASSCATAA